jgi:hypothetical protein
LIRYFLLHSDILALITDPSPLVGRRGVAPARIDWPNSQPFTRLSGLCPRRLRGPLFACLPSEDLLEQQSGVSETSGCASGGDLSFSVEELSAISSETDIPHFDGIFHQFLVVSYNLYFLCAFLLFVLY